MDIGRQGHRPEGAIARGSDRRRHMLFSPPRRAWVRRLPARHRPLSWERIMDRGIKDQTAIAGIGLDDLQPGSGTSTKNLAAQASLNAIADAGLAVADIDGIVSFYWGSARICPGPSSLPPRSESRIATTRIFARLEAPGAAAPSFRRRWRFTPASASTRSSIAR